MIHRLNDSKTLEKSLIDRDKLPPMTILFPCNPLSPRKVEWDYANEYESAKKVGFDTALFDFDALTRDNNLQRALRFVPEAPPHLIYRGWMLKSENYSHLYDALVTREQTLINTPENYQLCHEIPRWLPLFKNLTPQTRWIAASEITDEKIASILHELRGSLIVKDFVKSRKHDWHEACFISDANDEEAALRVIHRFIELQGENLYGGLVLRRFVPLESIGQHPRSRMPLGREWRIFAKGDSTFALPYWGQNDSAAPDLTPFKEAMSQIKSNFWTMDLARTQKGDCIVMELGDGQVSGLPEGANVEAFYCWLRGEN